MAREVMVWNAPTLKIATTEAGLATGLAVECQVNSAVLTPSPVYQTIPSTGCAGASQSPGLTGFALDLAWLQDWSLPDDESLSRLAWDNDGMPMWVELVPNAADAASPAMVGQFFVSSGGFGATFGDGSAAATTASWPAVSKPTIAAVAAP